jgi:transcriptional regulator with XRE-family HTH domain
LILEIDRLMASENKNAALKSFGAEVERRRKDAGFRYAKDFAAAMGVSPQYIAQLENGYSADGRAAVMPSDEVVDNIAKLLNWRKIDILLTIGVLTPSDIGDDGAILRKTEYEPILEEMRGASHDGTFSRDDAEEIAEIMRLRRERRRRSLS